VAAVAGAADGYDGVPDSDGAGEVDFDNFGAGENFGDGEARVANTGGAELSCLADFDNGHQVQLVFEYAARACGLISCVTGV